MFTLFSRIILANWRSLAILFFVIFFASTGFVTLRQITTNIESSVASETRPLFWADLIVSPRTYASGDILPLVEWYLTWEDYRVAEKREFSTTILDNAWKIWLVQIVAYSGSYPQRGILQVEKLKANPWSVAHTEIGRVWATSWLIDRFASGGVIFLDGKKLSITEKILESSDLGFSFGTENHLLVLSSDLLSGSLLLSSGSRLDHDLLISFRDERRAWDVANTLKKIFPENLYRIRTYEDRTERNLDTVDTLTDYITLILLIASVFAFVILRSAHESLYESLSRILRIVEILGLTRKKQQIIMLMLYIVIFPLAFFLSIGLSFVLIDILRSLPEAKEFQFFWIWVPKTLLLLLTIVVMAWWPIWWKIGRGEAQDTPDLWDFSLSSERNPSPKKWYHVLRISSFERMLRVFLRIEIVVPLLFAMMILSILFEDIVFSLLIIVGASVFLLLSFSFLRVVYEWIFRMSEGSRRYNFFFYDAIRTLVRPLTPTIPITLSLVAITVFFLVFGSFSLAFRSKLILDSTTTANIYAINILKSDKEWVEKVIGNGALMYDILRARIEKINGRSLKEHFGWTDPSGEFTREFNITTTPLQNRIIRWKNTIEKWELSLDDDFGKRLSVRLGDTVTFLVSWREITLRVASIRESIREGFRPFFYFSFDPLEFASAPRTYFVADYARDTEMWKKNIFEASWPHVTFVDIESILKIVRDISTKVLSVIWLFFVVVLLFAIGAIIAFFTRMRPIENMKRRLYSLFGAGPRSIDTSLFWSRAWIFIVSYLLSVAVGFLLSYLVVSQSAFFVFSPRDFFSLSGLVGGVYIFLWRFFRS
jgi:putative ABC transport system permease protein